MIMIDETRDAQKFEVLDTQEVFTLVDSTKGFNFLSHYQHKLSAQGAAMPTYSDSVNDNGQLVIAIDLED